MKTIFEWIFWIGIAIVFFTYFVYSILLYILVKIKNIGAVTRFEPIFEPLVALVVPCFNEPDNIEDKLLNSLHLDFPKEKLQLIFISVGSNEETIPPNL